MTDDLFLRLSVTIQGKPTLLIGHHLLEGKIATINKPLAILTRSTADLNSATNSSISPSEFNPKGHGKDSVDSNVMDCDDDGGDGNGQITAAPPARPTQWEAVGIVKRKIVFAKRPMPIVGRQS
jgi:chromosome transmission fidelity protein 8